MKKIYKIETGLTKIKTNTKKYVAAIISSVAIVGVAVVPAMAAKPVIQGCFGADRAAYIHNVAQIDPTAPGASEVGQILSERAGTNGAINQAYKTGCGGDPITN